MESYLILLLIRNPALIYVYGAYGKCLDLSFRPEILPLLELGWVVVLAHVRFYLAYQAEAGVN